MFFLNLSLGEFLALLGSASAIVVALYLFDRSRRRQVVATLRFWAPAEQPVTATRRRRIQQPWSLLLQLISIALLLAAIAQLRIGSQGAVPFDHILVLDTSAWMGARAARGPRGTTLMDEARARARAWIKLLPGDDRVMVLYADALAATALPFETRRDKIEQAIAAARAGSTALNLDEALEFARHTLSLSARRAGEIVFVGAGRISEQESSGAARARFTNLRWLAVGENPENVGLRKIGLRQSAGKPGFWEIYVSVRNYGTRPQSPPLTLQFGGAPAGSAQLRLAPGAQQEATFEYRTHAAGLLEARLLVRDAFPGDDRAVLELPELKTLRVAVYTADPDALRPVVEADPRVAAAFAAPAQYNPKPDADLVILDRFRPPSRPVIDSIWIDPPSGGSPVPIKSQVRGARFTRWQTGHPLGAGLRTRDLIIDSVSVFEAAPDDIRIAEVEAGPVVVARPSKPKVVVLGFQPTRGAMRFELATPLLFANTLRWMAPNVFRRWEVNVGSVGTVDVPLDPEARPQDVAVKHEDGRPLPFTLRDRSVHFFSGVPGTVRVASADRELVYSLTLPEMAEAKWDPPAGVKKGLPAAGESSASAFDAWQILAFLGGVGLLTEWFLFGRFGRGSLSLFSRTARVQVLSRGRG